MITALRTEYRKLVTTRLWWVLLLSMAVLMAFFAAAIGFSATIPVDEGGMGAPAGAPSDPVATALGVYSIAAGFGYVFPVIVGALSVTGEFRHMTITPTLLAEPRRSLLISAKLVAAVPVGLLFGLVGTASTVGGGAALLELTGGEAMLGDAEVQRGLAFSVVALTVWTLVGVGFGTVLTHQVGAIVVILAYNQLVEPLVRIFLGTQDWGREIASYLPGAAAEAVVGSSVFASMGAVELLEWWQGLLVLVGYAVVFAAIGRLTTFRRDIT
ncbi:ABC transporter permease [Cellulomonas sp. APG4]|uniref:ABC transporter permease n=1 Tax=Cellulomonas sp. APG4 TaxID=1538656 RepID=UPI00137A04B8|nr:ABC transporter permease [Cellulomonas sp. APG4]NCT91389.1 ABC transporter permease [Cellulomonas sp. APG4]